MEDGSPSHVCFICDRPFANVQNLNRHIRNVHHEESASGQRKMPCALCGQENSSQQLYIRHLQSQHYIQLDIHHHVFPSFEGKLNTFRGNRYSRYRVKWIPPFPIEALCL